MFDLLSLLTLEQNMISWKLISLQGTVVEKHWEISFISVLRRLPAVKQRQAFSPKPLVMRVHQHPKDYQFEALIGCRYFISHPLRAGLTMTAVTVFSCLLSTRSTAAWLRRVLQEAVFVFVSRYRHSPLLGRPKVFYLWEMWNWEVHDYFKPPNISVATFSPNLSSAGATGIAFVAWQR